jgi:hypothetical protein
MPKDELLTGDGKRGGSFAHRRNPQTAMGTAENAHRVICRRLRWQIRGCSDPAINVGSFCSELVILRFASASPASEQSALQNLLAALSTLPPSDIS